MKFTPKLPDDSVNVSKTHPLVELFWLLGGLVLACEIVFALLGLAADWAAAKIPINMENWLGDQALSQFPSQENPELKLRLQDLLDKVPSDSPLRQYHFRVFLSSNEEVNALAFPGGNIVVYSGLLKEIESENELSMILGHELGHFAHRDHLRALGRGLGLAVASALLFGQDSTTSRLVSNTLLSFQVAYSKAQEAAADRFGLELLNRRYGHAGGGTDFFVRMAKKTGGRLPYLLASHPHPQVRIEKLHALIDEHGYQVGATLPLADGLRKTAD